jgi:hypothetical protein
MVGRFVLSSVFCLSSVSCLDRWLVRRMSLVVSVS